MTKGGESLTRTIVASNESDLKKTEIIEEVLPCVEKENEIRLKVNKVGLSANNKFYMDFGKKSPFNFFKVWPMTKKEEGHLVNVPAWGIGTVVESNHPKVPVGQEIRGFFHMTDYLQFQVQVKEADGSLSIIRGKDVSPDYGNLTVVKPGSIVSSSSNVDDQAKSDLALTCMPGILTGFGLSQVCIRESFYGAKGGLVLTSASSKVALATAIYLRQTESSSKKLPIIGYTSSGSCDFLRATGLYDIVVPYEDDIPEQYLDGKLMLIEISGRAGPFLKYKEHIVKALAVGNAQGVTDKDTLFAHFSTYATMKMLSSMMGIGPDWLWNRLPKPQTELFLIVKTMQELNKEWGQDKVEECLEKATVDFVESQRKNIIISRSDQSVVDIQEAFTAICEGSVPPSKAVIVDVGSAVTKLKK